MTITGLWTLYLDYQPLHSKQLKKIQIYVGVDREMSSKSEQSDAMSTGPTKD